MNTDLDSDISLDSIDSLPRAQSGNSDITERRGGPQQDEDCDDSQWGMDSGSDSDTTIIHSLSYFRQARGREGVDSRQSSEADFRCSGCHKEYQHSSTLKRHIIEKHIRPMTFNCDRCSRQFVRKYQLQKHKRQKHDSVY